MWVFGAEEEKKEKRKKLQAGRMTTDVCHQYCCRDMWNQIADMNIPRRFHAMAACNNSLYVFGGRNDASSMSSVERWDPRSVSEEGLTGCLLYAAKVRYSSVRVARP